MFSGLKMPRYGNFPDYYNFNPADNRMKVFESDTAQSALRRLMFDASTKGMIEDPFLILDVGCNTGELTKRFGRMLAASASSLQTRTSDSPINVPSIKVFGLEKDAELAAKARQQVKTSPSSKSSTPEMDRLDMACEVEVVNADLMDFEATDALLTEYLAQHGKDEFDLVTCFSVLMWIHLNHDDDGLNSAVDFLSQRTRHMLVEVQPWKCYQTAARRMRRAGSDAFPFMRRIESSKLKKPPDVEGFILTKIRPHYEEERLLGKSDSWKRGIYLFSK